MARAKRLAVEEGELRATLIQVTKYDEQEIQRVLAEIDQRLKHRNPTFAQKRKFIEWSNVQGKLDGDQVKFKMEIGITFDVEKQPPRKFCFCAPFRYWYHCGENMAIRQLLRNKELQDFVGDIDDKAPYRAE